MYKRSFWTESYVQWSPRGNYMTTVHRQGVALWGGPGFARFAKFSHNGVQFIEFSPCERYLASGSTHDPANAREQAQVVVNFFDVRSGAKLRSFQVSLYHVCISISVFPYFRISVPVWAIVLTPCF